MKPLPGGQLFILPPIKFKPLKEPSTPLSPQCAKGENSDPNLIFPPTVQIELAPKPVPKAVNVSKPPPKPAVQQPVRAQAELYESIFTDCTVLPVPLSLKHTAIIRNIEKLTEILDWLPVPQELRRNMIYFVKKPTIIREYGRAKVLNVNERYVTVLFVDYLVGARVNINDIRVCPPARFWAFEPSYIS